MTKNNKALIVSPYLDHLGGGERYMLEAARVIGESGYLLHFAWDNANQINSLASQLGFKLPPVKLVPRIKDLYFGSNPLAMWAATRQFDLIFYLSDGSIPALGGKKNILHMQVPHHGVGGKSLANRLKLVGIHSVIVNSHFTKTVVDQEYGISSCVIHPPLSPIKAAKKDKIILSVGRFEPSLNIKRHEVMIQTFGKLSPKLPGWKLVLVGASTSDKWVNQLMDMAVGLPVEFVSRCQVSSSQNNLLSGLYLLARRRIRGSEKASPQLCEHFGISIAEAITAGCIPLVVGKGGVGEIVPDPAYYWDSPRELINKTLLAASGSLLPTQLPTSVTVSSFTKSITSLC